MAILCGAIVERGFMVALRTAAPEDTPIILAVFERGGHVRGRHLLSQAVSKKFIKLMEMENPETG